LFAPNAGPYQFVKFSPTPKINHKITNIIKSGTSATKCGIEVYNLIYPDTTYYVGTSYFGKVTWDTIPQTSSVEAMRTYYHVKPYKK